MNELPDRDGNMPGDSLRAATVTPEPTAAERLAEMERWRKRRDAVYGFVGAATAIVRQVKRKSSTPEQAIEDLREQLRHVYEVLGWDAQEME